MPIKKTNRSDIFSLVLLVFSSLMVTSAVLINAEFESFSGYAQDNDRSNIVGTSSNKKPGFMGVAMRGYYTSAKQSEESDVPFPKNYYEDSFRLIHDAGMNHVRYLFYWESYEKNPSLFMRELTAVAQNADKWGIKVLYDNHQWHTSSWLESRGTGFPSSLFENNLQYENDAGGNTNDESAEDWWTNWWDRSIKDKEGNDGWFLQAEFLKKIVNVLDSYKSTLGYELLSEPQIHSDDQWEKVGEFNTFMVNELRNVTQKTLAYSQQVPASINAPNIDVTPENQAKMAPANKTNVVFKISIYGLSTEPFHERRLDGLVKAAEIATVPLYVGEWNNVVREKSGGVFKINTEKSDINQEDVNLFLKDFVDLGVWGWAYWLWNFNSHRVPNFNLMLVSEEEKVVPTKYYEQLKNGISSEYNS